MQRTRLLLSNTLYAASASTIAQILAFLMLPLLINKVGTADFGIYSLAAASIGYFGLVSLPARTAVVKFVAEYGAANDPQKLNHLFNSALIINVATGVLIGGVLLGAAVFAGELFRIEAADLPRVQVLLYVYAAATLVIQPLSVFGSWLYGFQQFAPIAALDALWAVSRSAMVLLIHFYDGSIFWYAAHELAFEALKGAALALLVRRRFRSLRLSPALVDRSDLGRILSYGGWSVLYVVALMIVYQGDRILIGVVLSVSLITYFHIAYTLYNVINTIAQYLRTAVLPSTAAAMAAGDSAFVEKLISRGTRAMLAVMLPICLHVLVFADALIAAWMGAEYVGTTGLLSRILIASWLFVLPTFLLVHVYWAQRNIATLSGVAFAVSILQLGLLVFLLRHIGLEGAAVATLAFFATLAPFQMLIIAKRLGIHVSRFLIRDTLPAYAFNAAYGAALAWLVHRMGAPDGLVSLLLVFGLSLTINVGACFHFVARDEGRLLIRKLMDGLSGARGLVER